MPAFGQTPDGAQAFGGAATAAPASTAAPTLRRALRPRTPAAPTSFASMAGAPGPQQAAPGAGGLPAGYTPPPPVQQARAAAQAATANVQNAPNRQQLAASALQLARDTTEEGYQTSLRDVARQAAATGRIGSGDTTTRLADVAMRRERDLDQLARSVSLDAAANEQSDLLARAGAANTLAGLLGSETRADEGVGMERSRFALDTELGRGGLALERDRLDQQGALTREGYDLTRSESAAERALRGALQTQSLDFQGQESLADRILRGALQTQNLTFQGQEGAAGRNLTRELATIEQIVASGIAAGRLDPSAASILGSITGGTRTPVGGGGGGGAPAFPGTEPVPGNPNAPGAQTFFDVANIPGSPSRNVLGGAGGLGATSPQFLAPGTTPASLAPGSGANVPLSLAQLLGGGTATGGASRPLSIADILAGLTRPSGSSMGGTGGTTAPTYRPPVTGQNTQYGQGNLWTPPNSSGGAGPNVGFAQQLRDLEEEYRVTPQNQYDVIAGGPYDPTLTGEAFDRQWEMQRAGRTYDAEAGGWVTPGYRAARFEQPRAQADYDGYLARVMSGQGSVPTAYQAMYDNGTLPDDPAEQQALLRQLAEAEFFGSVGGANPLLRRS